MQLIARERELADVVDRVEQGRQLVTVIGPGGIGKTTLARAAVDVLAPAFPMGAHVVELSRIERPDAVGATIAAQLGFAGFDVLLTSPVDLPALLLVDNCEHVADAAADALAALLDACAAVTVVATSRSPLAIPGESIVALAPLAVPPAGSLEDTGAVQLFRERARDAGAPVEDADHATVVDLCRRLDGLPLAIELAAARLRVMGVADLAAAVDDDVDTLTRAPYRGAGQHRSLRDTIAWSTRLLDPGDAEALDVLAAFAGPFTTPLAAGLLDVTSPAAAATIEHLVDASLVTVDRTGPRTRYRMLEPIRAVALDQLRQRDGLDDVHERLAALTHHEAVAMLAESTRRWDADLLPTLIDRFDQIDVAIRHCLEHDDEPRRALALYNVLWGTVHQARVDDVLALGALVTERWPDVSVPFGSDAAATFAMGTLLCGRTDEARSIANAALPYADASVFAPVALRRVLALAARIDGDHETAAALLAEAADAARAHGIVTMDLECQTYRAQDLACSGRADEALRIVAAVATQARALDSILNEIWAHSVEAAVRAGSDDAAERARARDLAADTLATSERIAYPFGIICNLQTLAAHDLRAGELAAAIDGAEQLLEAVFRSGAGDLRRALDVAAAVLHATGCPEVGALVATARNLPDTNPMIVALPPLPPELGTGVALDRPAVVRLTHRLLADARARIDGDHTTSAAAGPTPELEPPSDPDDPANAGDPGDRHDARFVRVGDVWEVTFAGSTALVAASKGMDDLAVLLARPGTEVHCVELAGVAVEQADTGEVIDGRARRSYEARIRELQGEVDDAEAANDRGRSERAQAELDALIDQLTSALGLSGTARRAGGTAERARSAVTHRLRSTMRRLGDENAALGRHLDASITTGAYCRYDPEVPVRWRT